jgi:hypothetical protein
MVNVHVWYDATGTIVAVGRVIASGDSSRVLGAVPVAREDREVLEADIGDDVVQRLHETHRVDVQADQRTIRPRDGDE